MRIPLPSKVDRHSSNFVLASSFPLPAQYRQRKQSRRNQNYFCLSKSFFPSTKHSSDISFFKFLFYTSPYVFCVPNFPSIFRSAFPGRSSSRRKMESCRRYVATGAEPGEQLKIQKHSRGDLKRNHHPVVLTLYVANAAFFALFFSVAYFLLHRWRGKIRTSTPLHVVTTSETAAIVSLVASVIYLLRFFSIQGARVRSDDELSDDEILVKEDGRNPGPCPAALVDPSVKAAAAAVIPSPKPPRPVKVSKTESVPCKL